ncbi:hypothetical protein [Anaerophaga thermohalophila]|jgi:plasmid stabilization system protein ParE|nr:hypothetical protein [Anaerophaga thermohalophila]
MAVKIVWSKRAENGYDKIIRYLGNGQKLVKKYNNGSQDTNR